MAHGLLIYGDFKQIGETLFEFASTRFDRVAFFANSNWADRANARNQHWMDALIRPLDGSLSDFGESVYSRYHPIWSKPFAKMCSDCLQSISYGIAFPYEAPDSEANRLGPQLDRLTDKVIPLLPSGKRVGRFFLPVQVTSWAMAFGYAYESCASIFLGDEQNLIDEFSASLQAVSENVRIQESW